MLDVGIQHFSHRLIFVDFLHIFYKNTWCYATYFFKSSIKSRARLIANRFGDALKGHGLMLLSDKHLLCLTNAVGVEEIGKVHFILFVDNMGELGSISFQLGSKHSQGDLLLGINFFEFHQMFKLFDDAFCFSVGHAWFPFQNVDRR